MYERNSLYGYALKVTTTIMLVLCWLTVGARIGIRIREKTLGNDDTAMAISLICFTTFSAYIFCAIDNHFLSTSSHPNWTEIERSRAGLYYLLALLMYTLSVVSIRTSIDLALLRIAQVQWHRGVLYAALGFISITALATVVSLAVSAARIQTQFEDGANIRTPAISLRSMVYIFSAASALEDLVIVVMPYMMLYNLQRHKSEKRGLIVLLALGGVAIIANIARFPFLPAIGKPGVEQRTGLFFCSMLELAIGIVAGSAVTLRTTIQRFWPRTKKRQQRRDEALRLANMQFVSNTV